MFTKIMPHESQEHTRHLKHEVFVQTVCLAQQTLALVTPAAVSKAYSRCRCLTSKIHDSKFALANHKSLRLRVMDAVQNPKKALSENKLWE